MYTNRVPMPVVNFGNSWEFHLGHFQAEIVQSVWNLSKDISVRKMTCETILTFWKNVTIENCGFWKSWEPYNFGWEIIRDNNLKRWEMVENLLISKVQTKTPLDIYMRFSITFPKITRVYSLAWQLLSQWLEHKNTILICFLSNFGNPNCTAHVLQEHISRNTICMISLLE